MTTYFIIMCRATFHLKEFLKINCVRDPKLKTHDCVFPPKLVPYAVIINMSIFFFELVLLTYIDGLTEFNISYIIYKSY